MSKKNITKKQNLNLLNSSGFEQLLSAIVDNSPVYFYVCGVRSECFYVSKKAAELLGCKQKDIIGRKLTDLTKDKRYVFGFIKDLKDAFRGKSVNKRKSLYPTVQGLRAFEYSINIIDISNKRYALVSIADIDELEKYKQDIFSSEQRYRQLFNNTKKGIAVYRTNDNGKHFFFEDFNKAAEKIDHVKREDLIGREINSVFPGARKFGIVDILQRVYLTGKSEFFPAKEYRDKNLIGWRENYIYRLPSGEIVAIYEDVTEAKKQEIILDNENKQFVSMFDSMDEVVYISDPISYDLLYVNKVFYKNWGEYKGKKCYKVLQNSNKPCSFCSNKYIFGQNLGKTYIWEFCNKVNNRWYRCIDRAIKWSDGRMVRFEIAVDIHDRKKTEENLEESERSFRAIFDNSIEGIVITDLKTKRFFHANKAMLRMLGGYSLEEIKQMHLKDIHPLEEEREHSDNFEKFAQKGKGFAKEVKVLKKDGTFFYADISAYSVSFFGNKYIVGVFRDVTPRVKFDVVKKNIIRDMSHSLKTPLAMLEMALFSMDNYLKNDQIEKAKQIAKIASNNVSKVKKDIDNISEAFSLDMRKTMNLVTQKEKIYLVGFLKGLLDKWRVLSAEKDINLVVDLPNKDFYVSFNKRDLFVILNNVIDNAFKFTPKGVITISLKKLKKYCQIMIEDTGLGIEKDSIDRIFERFFRGNVASEGTGLGLSVSKDLLDIYGGSIKIGSKGKHTGTKVLISLPLDNST